MNLITSVVWGFVLVSGCATCNILGGPQRGLTSVLMWISCSEYNQAYSAGHWQNWPNLSK